MSFIVTEDLKFSYNEDTALDNLNLEIKKGEFIAIVGHNGCGKSTLAKTFNGMIIPTNGKVFVKGMATHDPSSRYKIRKQVGLVLQNPENQIVSSVVCEDVAFGPENLCIPPEEILNRVEFALKSVNMYSKKDSLVHDLSGGQKQKIAIAGIIAMEPECIIFDEPTSMLDPVSRKEIINTILRLNKDLGITIILITHFMDDTLNADRLILMNKGKIVADDTPRKIFSDKDLMKKNSLTLPKSTQLAYFLKEKGVRFNNLPITAEEFLEYINPILKSKKLSKIDFIKNTNFTNRNILELKNVFFSYDDNQDLEKSQLFNVDLSIKKGEFLSIVGTAGSGKSTLLKIISGLISPSAGKILADKKLKTGIAFQYPEHQLFEETVYKDIAFGPNNINVPKNEIQKRIIASAEFVGLSADLLEKSPFELSGGEKRKAAIAGVIAMDPDILILDEPTSGLDPLSSANLLKNIKKYQETRKNTIIMVSHNMDEVYEYSDRVAVMHKGSIVMCTDPYTLFKDHDFLLSIGLEMPELAKITHPLNNILEGNIITDINLLAEIFEKACDKK